jgi:hypothetical protein
MPRAEQTKRRSMEQPQLVRPAIALTAIEWLRW